MKLPVLLCVVVFSIILAFFIHRGKEETAKEQNDFWERERAANNTRRKSLDNLDYITIPVDVLPMDTHTEDDNINEYIQTIGELAKSPIVNLTGISNTDLKLKYGAPNIDILAQYDGRYTTLASTLQKWAEALLKLEDTDSARKVLEFAVSTGTDVSGTYRLLADIYKNSGDTGAIKELRIKALNINTPLKASILEYLDGCINRS